MNAKQHRSLEAMKRSLIQEWEKLPMTTVRSAIDCWRDRLQHVVDASGGRFKSNLKCRLSEDH